MQAHRRPHPEITRERRAVATTGARGDLGPHTPGQFHRLPGAVRVGADADHTGDPGEHRVGEQRRELVSFGPVPVLEMTVRIDPAGARRPADAGAAVIRAVAGTAAPPFSTLQAAGVAPPRGVAGRRSIPGLAVEPEPPPDLLARAAASPAPTSSATIRSDSRALPSTASTAGPARPSTARPPRARRSSRGSSRHVASSATWGARAPTPRSLRCDAQRRHAQRAGCRGRRRGPTPPHLRPDHRCHAGQQIARDCWPDPRCTGRRCPRRRSRRRVRRACRAGGGTGTASTPKSAVRSRGAIWLARLATSSRPTRGASRGPSSCAGGSMPAAMHMAGHQTQWNRMMSLPRRWWTDGHHASKRAGSAP